MVEFERLLDAYIGGRVDLNTLHAGVDALHGAPHDAASVALAALEAARVRGLTESVYRNLHSRLVHLCDGEATRSQTSRRAHVDDSTTAMHRGLGEPEGPTELNPAAGYSDDEVAERREQLSNTTRRATPQDGHAESTITDMGVVGTGEEPTGTLWPGLYDETGVPEREFRKGEILRGRFELIAKLGEGGMGAVWKGKDLLKEEAKDRNPYVAIKLLQADFKKHPEAFIALQRETSKQQRLAHPNIATVYDFDRDERTQTVFMTMEVMEGQPLDAFIRTLPADGLPADRAISIIEQLAAGLSYAHENGLVHSDLKPGNCFITSDGTVKLLDFGIARASKSKSDAEGETTLFDPAELGALTPTYATLEMFEGEDPDPRDDVFALAILSYQLFTGRHPYAKNSAPKAEELGLRPARVKKLSKRQNRGLAHGLALHREERTASVPEFLDDVRRRHSKVTYAVAGTLAAALLIAALAYKPVSDLYQRRQHEEVIAALEQPGMQNIRKALSSAASLGNEELQRIIADERTKRAIIAHIGQAQGERMDQWLTFVRTFPKDFQRDILDDERAYNAVVREFEARIFAAFDPAARLYDYPQAHRLVTMLGHLYPDSAAALRISKELDARRDNALDRLGDRFNRYLEAGLLTREDGRHAIGDVLDAVRQMSPTDPLLNDDRLRLRYGELAEQALQAGDLQRASTLVHAGLEYAPGDPALKDLNYQVQTATTRAENQRRVAEVEVRLATQLVDLERMSDFDAHRPDLLILAELDPASTTLARARVRLEKAMDANLGRLLGEKRYDTAWHALLDYAPLLDLDYLRAARQKLPAEISAASHQPWSPARDDPRVRAHVDAITGLLMSPQPGSVWQAALESKYKELVVLLPHDHPVVTEQRDRIARHFLAEARRARSEESFNEARTAIDRGRVYDPEFSAFAAESDALAEARMALQARRESERLAALKAGLEANFRSKAETNQIQEAKSLLHELRTLEKNDENDRFINMEAPRLLSEAYKRLAATRAARQDFEGAISLARAGLDQWPKDDELRARVAGYAIALENQRFERALRTRLSDAGFLDVESTAADLARLEARFPDRYSEIASELAALREKAVLDRAQKAKPIGEGTAKQLSAHDALFPAERGALDEALAAVLEERIRAELPAQVDDLEALRATVRNVSAFPPAQAERLQHAIADVAIAAANTRASRDIEGARRILASVRTLLPNEPDLVAASRALPLAELERARAEYEAGALTGAASELRAAAEKDADYPGIAKLRDAIESAMHEAESAYDRYVSDVEDAEPRDQRTLDARYRRIVALWSDNPALERHAVPVSHQSECRGALAGFGAQAGGTCYDLVDGHKGPEMVVVPPGDGLDKAYAIGKYEVSVAEFNQFCASTKRCATRSRDERRLPITRISVADAEAYASWLSAQASRSNAHPIVYRLPTDAEWEHAARAEGHQPERQFNCRVVAAGEIISGHDLVNARSGRQNGWGLANYAGNAREWVRSAEGLSVRGGAYADPLTECGPDLGEAHSGKADAVTGFRLVRELG